MPKTFTLSVTNTDNAPCTSTTFALSGIVPAGWTKSVTPVSMTLAPGATATANVTVTPPTGTLDASYSIQAQADDSSVSVHHASTSATYVSSKVVPDTTAPTITITSPSNGAKVKGNNNLTISTTASDAGGVASILIQGDSTTLATCTNTTACSATWLAKNISAGLHVITATATDKAGNTKSASIMVTK